MIREGVTMMNEIDNIFNELINAHDNFLSVEEKEIGCLTAEEHANLIKIRNYIDDVFMRVINAESKQPKKQSIDTTLPIIVDNDDEGGADICFNRRSQHEFEM